MTMRPNKPDPMKAHVGAASGLDRDWLLFLWFGVEFLNPEPELWENHVHWLAARFDTPTDWLGDHGCRFRGGLNWKNPSAEFLKAWAHFQVRYSILTLDDMEALYRTEIMA